MLLKNHRFYEALLCVAASLAFCAPLSAHPGHGAGTNEPLPVWHLADGGTMSAYLMKSEDGRAWFVDGEQKTSVVEVAALDDAGQQAVRKFASRMRIINIAREVQRPANLLAMALGGVVTQGEEGQMPESAKVFGKFAGVKTRWDAENLYVESNGIPDHPMMIGITSWQQQVPLPQSYFGDNAWRVPLHPTPAQEPAMIKGRFLRGAIALAVNGIPIFNPQNNRGEVSYEIGELDQWGGHCGRADDYHYHIVPMHLQKVVGKGMPLAYALDGYPIYGATEPDGSPVGTLDVCHGHMTPGVGYHYHASMKYPYVLAGFHGQVVERDGQVDPQPQANPVREALSPMRGAKIIDFKSVGKDANELTYEVNSGKGTVSYALNTDSSYTFTFVAPDGEKQTQTYQRGRGGGGRGRSRDQNRSPQDENRPQREQPARAQESKPKMATDLTGNQKNESGFQLRSPEVANGGALPREFTGDGASATLPLEWSGAPAGTKSYALIMHHIPGPGDVKWYWILYGIPADVHSLPKNVQDIGTLGNNSVNRRAGYAPPHSKGPGAKTYILTLYALSEAPTPSVPAEEVDRATLLSAMEGKILASAELKVTYDRTSILKGGGSSESPRDERPDNGPPMENGDRPGGGGGAIHLMPRELEEKLNLTAEQRTAYQALEKETQEKLFLLLTPEQVKIIKSAGPPGPPPPRD